MSLLPWDDWIYHLSYKRDEINQLHTTAVDLQSQIQSQVDLFNGQLDTYKTLVAGNSALVIVANVLTYKDLQYKDFIVQVDAVENPPVGFVPVSVASMIDELAGGVLVLKALANIGQMAKDGLLGTSEDLPEAVGESAMEDLTESSVEAGVEAGTEEGTELTAETIGEGVAEGAAEGLIEGATLSSLGSIGIGIFAAVAIDVIFGVINGQSESSELDASISKLQSAIGKCQIYYNQILSKMATLDGAIVKEETRFKGLVTALAQVSSPASTGIDNKPTFGFNFDPTVANSSRFIGAMRSALAQYGAFAQMRNSWVTADEKNPMLTKAAFLAAESVISALDEATLDQYFKILAAYSDSMQAKIGE